MIDLSKEKSESTEMLESMDLESLKELRIKLDRTIASYESRKRREALSAMEQVAREHGFKLAELLGEGRSGKGRKSTSRPAKYVNPADPEQTWSGRGRRPRWINDAFRSGRVLDELAA
jgi:DNA-binding protein H-NS